MKSPSCLLIALLIVCYSNNAASCEASAQVTRLESHFLQRKPLERIIPPPTVREGQCIQQKLIERLTHQLGPVTGYKAGLTSEVVRRRFSVTEPVSGALLRDMLLTDGASISIDFGAKGFMEIDVIVVVGKVQALQAARDPVEAANFIVAFHPFLELPDWVFEDPSSVTAGEIAAVNVGARSGVLGPRIDLTPPVSTEKSLSEWRYQVLGNLRAVLSRSDGSEVAQGATIQLDGHPMNVVLWLVKNLKSRGISLREGDLLSLGSMSRPLQPVAGETYKLKYYGLEQVIPAAKATANASVTVQFDHPKIAR